MIYNIISPFSLSVNADSYKEAVKQFIKINYNLNINRLIIQNQNNYMKAKVDYYNKLGYKKIGIKLKPYNNLLAYPTSNVISPISTLLPSVDIQQDDVTLSPLLPLSLVQSPLLPIQQVSPMSSVYPLSPLSPMSSVQSPLSPMINDNIYSLPTKVSKKELNQKIFNLSLLNKF
jgi:hypothetical protein